MASSSLREITFKGTGILGTGARILWCDRCKQSKYFAGKSKFFKEEDGGVICRECAEYHGLIDEEVPASK